MRKTRSDIAQETETMNEPAAEPHGVRLKRLRMRSWRRGTKEMDLVLGPFADAELQRLDAVELDALEALLSENDQDLYLWISRVSGFPDRYEAIIKRIARFSGIA
jgi:antitoxin CptB